MFSSILNSNFTLISQSSSVYSNLLYKSQHLQCTMLSMFLKCSYSCGVEAYNEASVHAVLTKARMCKSLDNSF